jgi:hypothetical protein
MSLAGVAKFVLGFALAIVLLAIAGVGVTRYLLGQLSTPPPRPTFPNDTAVNRNSPSPAASPAAPQANTAASPSPQASPSPTEGYLARVTEPIGLIVRQDPEAAALEIEGVDFEQQVTVLETTPDGAWERIRLTNGAEGWVRGGNTEKLN